MSNLDLNEGFKFWRDEVTSLEQPERQVVYTPVIALVGIYTAAVQHKEQLNSYSWRQAVLHSDEALEGLRLSISSLHNDRIDDTFELPIEFHKPDEGAALQYVCSHASLIDGIPEETSMVAENEWFLAQNLGYAEHDYSVTFNPLRLSAGGIESIRNNYPQTSRLIGEYL